MSRRLVVSLLALSLLAVVSAENVWCNIKSCSEYSKGIHTLCAYPNPGAAPQCGELGGGLSDTEKKGIVNLHNQLRQTVASGNEHRGPNGPQPRAKGGRMPNLKWDDTLASIAQRWADQCDFKHDKCRDVPASQVGQNIAYKGTTGKVSSIDVLDMVRKWYDEVQYFNRNEVKKYSGAKGANGKNVGHYTQLVWAETRKVGCGVRNYPKGEFNRRYLVCNYEPSGNFIGSAIYETDS